MGDETEQPGQRAPGHPDGPPAAGPDPAADPTSEAPDRPRRRALRPLEALERLDRQWESSEPIGSASSLTSLELTVPEDPRGFDYLGALSGDAPATVATAEADETDEEATPPATAPADRTTSTEPTEEVR
jgi:hypothetical protein